MDQDRLRLVIDLITQTTDLLYQENIEQAYKILPAVLQELETAIFVIEDESVQAEMKEQLLEALRAMEENDYIILADIMQYEINERLLESVEG